MGGCCSKQESSEPNETTRLLSNNVVTTQPEPTTMEESFQQIYQAKLEAETKTLNQIVSQTEENLIDISRLDSNERLKSQEGTITSHDYDEILTKSQRLKQHLNSKKRISSIFNTAPENSSKDAYSTLNTMAVPDLTQLNQISKDIQDTLKSFEVQSTQDLIVPLSFSNSSLETAAH